MIWPGGVTLSYDPLGRLYQVAGPSGTTRFLYDGDALVAEYDAAGTLLRRHVHWPGADVPMISYEGANPANARQLIADHQGSIVASVDMAGAVIAINRYDAVSRLTQIAQNPSGTTYDLTLDLGYNPAGQIVSTTRSNPGSGPGQADAYAWGGHYQVSRSYTASGLNQYTATGSVTPTYDARGNLASAGGTTYSYDSTNRLVATPDAVLKTDPAGRLFAIGTIAGETYLLNSGDRMIGEYSPTGAVLRRYVHGPGVDEPLVWYEGSAPPTAATSTPTSAAA